MYYCHTCQTPHWQPFGRVQERVSAKNGNVNFTYHVPSGPPEEVKGDKCGECGGKFHVRPTLLFAGLFRLGLARCGAVVLTLPPSGLVCAGGRADVVGSAA